MKKLCLFAVLILLALPISAKNNAYASEITYALIGENATLYRLSEGEFIPVTSLPSTYFVAILGEESSGYIKVSYLDIDGFIKASDITLVDYIAQSTSLTLSNDGHLVNFRASPSSQGKILSTISSGEIIYYYGQVSGENSNPLIGDTWYFARCVSSSGESIYGYVYSLYAVAQPILPNEIVAENPPSESLSPSANTSVFSLGQTRQIVIIVSLCLPVLAISYLIFRNEKRL